MKKCMLHHSNATTFTTLELTSYLKIFSSQLEICKLLCSLAATVSSDCACDSVLCHFLKICNKNNEKRGVNYILECKDHILEGLNSPENSTEI